MQRQTLRSDPELRLGVKALATPPAPSIAFEPPPVVKPRQRPVEEEPGLPFSEVGEVLAAVPAEVPVVVKRSESRVPTPVLSVAIVEPPPERATPTEADIERVRRAPFGALFGAAGSGKTWLTKEWAAREGGVMVMATTGIAAVNCDAETINSRLGYFDTASMQEAWITGALGARLGRLWRAGIRKLVIDEVSMMAAEQVTFLKKAIDEVNGRGYVIGKYDSDDDGTPPSMSVCLVGDFCQLGPVKAHYAFESPEFDSFRAAMVTLTEIKRQSDPDFVTMLRAARAGRGHVVAEYFASRNAIHQETDDHFDGPTILAKNESVDRFNALRLSQLSGATLTFPSHRWGKLRSEWGQLEKPEHTWGVPKVLTLKEGALCMVLANYRDPETHRLLFVNGDLGVVLGQDENGSAIVRLQRTGEEVEVYPIERKVRVPCDSARRAELLRDGKGDRIDKKWEIVGEIVYTPLRVAYASTCHKSQGLSLDRVQLNLRDAFWRTPGMVYVGLSRCRTAEGLRVVASPQTIIERCTSDPKLREWL